MISQTAAAVAGIMEGWSRHRRPIFMIWNPSTSFSGAMALQTVRSSMWSRRHTALNYSCFTCQVPSIPPESLHRQTHSPDLATVINYCSWSNKLHSPLKGAVTISPFQAVYWKLGNGICHSVNTRDSVKTWEPSTQLRTVTARRIFKQVTSESLLHSGSLKYEVAQEPQQTSGEQLYALF